MHFRFSLATVALMGICSASAIAQTPAQPVQPTVKVGPTSVALVDVGFLIRQHPTMNAEIERIKEEMNKAQEEIETRRKDLLAQGESVSKAYDSSSAEYKQKQELLLNQESKLRVDFMDKEKGFAERQAAVVAKSYRDISSSIDYVANHYKFDLVLRFSREQNEMDPKKPRTVDYGIQRDVLFQAGGMDLTDVVLKVLASSVGQSKGTASNAPAAQTATGPGQRPTR